MKTILFACVQNAARSQMAAAFCRELVDASQVTAISAGTQPADRLDAVVVEVMQEVGIELGDVKPQPLTARLQGEVQFLVTMGCGEVCPLIPAFRRSDWSVPDPAGQPIERVREIRDEIRRKVEELVDARGWRR
jgi:arsenate reductase